MAKKPEATPKKAAGPRVLTCIVTGMTFTYSGSGRPPKYHPDAKKQILAEQRKTNRAQLLAAGMKKAA